MIIVNNATNKVELAAPSVELLSDRAIAGKQKIFGLSAQTHAVYDVNPPAGNPQWYDYDGSTFTLNAFGQQEQAKENEAKIIDERDRRIDDLVNSTGKSKTSLLMKGIALTHAKQGRPLNSSEQAKEAELLTVMAQIEAIETAADDAIANNTPVGDIAW